MSSDHMTDYDGVLRRLAIQAEAKPRIIGSYTQQPSFSTPKPKMSRRPRLLSGEYDEVLTNYWYSRPETAHDRERFVEAAMDWVVYAFLHENADHGKGRNHEIEATPDTQELIERLERSCERMQHDLTCRVEMRSVCWWDVQEHYHNLRSRDINQLADDLMDPLIVEAIERLKATGFIYWHSGVWTLSAKMSHKHILRLKQSTVFLAPEPSKLSGIYVA